MRFFFEKSFRCAIFRPEIGKPEIRILNVASKGRPSGRGKQGSADRVQFGVAAEVEGRTGQLVLLNLPFGRLIDEIIVPYDKDEAFFIDGVPVTRKTIRRIKIIELDQAFRQAMWELEVGLKRGEPTRQKIYGDQYVTRFEHILRNNAPDVTAQVLKAYNQAVKPSLKDYIPKREELISAATNIFVEAMKALSR
ncbi:MAG: hypothetical protein A3G39_00330 [Deltaproteobacteria bacterium RIFCSPLOWO2_12_FULL_43_16]|nr:MAG: hypothetical protein A2Z89_08935 [Deltaproteobacteria bacterium GWA2_43_19]OGQ13101.1 MAG: hypothetical protein A3D30_09820 [Deltaproteobacteria bacterium RIFCSPHIGHO2_02_FULL_43_33]OGQ61812.1 MAG: hypothetical protein A3G39_00330 [Deltaproteobacteria bacterium RIFCSPLOWO2_12_FULL_43_16]HBR16987.1 hypothetical protein [Deltaproteobacteria bacterium]